MTSPHRIQGKITHRRTRPRRDREGVLALAILGSKLSGLCLPRGAALSLSTAELCVINFIIAHATLVKHASCRSHILCSRAAHRLAQTARSQSACAEHLDSAPRLEADVTVAPSRPPAHKVNTHPRLYQYHARLRARAVCRSHLPLAPAALTAQRARRGSPVAPRPSCPPPQRTSSS
jgi:hypothetical protein